MSLLHQHIAIVGMMGCGKSTVGRMLADWLGCRFVDTDAQIEFEQGKSIPDIFAASGEPAFRDIERALLPRVLEGSPAIISTGGGIFMAPDNRAILIQKSATVYLKASPEQLFERVRHSRNRPLLHTDDPLATIRSLLAAREPAYLESRHTVDVEGKNSQQVAEEIRGLVSSHHY